MKVKSVAFGGRKNFTWISAIPLTSMSGSQLGDYSAVPFPLFSAPRASVPSAQHQVPLLSGCWVDWANVRHKMEPEKWKKQNVKCVSPHSSSDRGYVPLSPNPYWFGYVFLLGSSAHRIQQHHSLPLFTEKSAWKK